MTNTCCGVEAQFNDKTARKELKRYRKKGLGKPTAGLLKLIRKASITAESLLDIGGGIGGIQHELVKNGAVTSIACVDASPAYLAAARSEAERQGYADRATYLSGDFVEKSDQVDAADLVTMDRVICCYHDVHGLLGAAASKARKAIGLVYPRESFLVRIGFRSINVVMKIKGDEFRAYLHPHATIEKLLDDADLELVEASEGLIWRTVVYRKRPQPMRRAAT